MHFFSALSLVGLGMAALTALFGASGRMAALGVVVFPLAALMLGAFAAYGQHRVEVLDWRLQLHAWAALLRSEEHTSELQSIMRISDAVFCLNKKQHITLTSRYIQT